MKIDRMFGIVYLLMGRDRLTAKQLAEHFEVSVRTIHRDVESLMQAGIPLYTSRGSEGGVSLVPGFALDKAVLTEEERSQILWGLQSLPQGDRADGEALKKLSALFDQPFPDWIEVDFSRWGHACKDDDRFETLHRALLSGRAVRFRYASTKGGVSEREAYPLKLVFKSKAWYVRAYCLAKNDYRTFRVNRMNALETTEATFDRTQFDPPAIEEPPAPYQLVTLKLVFEPRAASRVYDEFDVDTIEVSDEGSIHVYTPYPHNDFLYDLLASFGNAVCVVAPAEVRERLQQAR
ncbi:MAG: YafY family protein [Gordonibacter sp.]|uniref:helix-turn-helix transcriptional regulator n=1 Tax=Gordonibacter sp. TaxID=1968902 RepID=UPI002FC68C43